MRESSNGDPGGEQAKITPPKTWAAGVPAVAHAVQYSLGETCAATYHPEANVLVPLDSVADTSNTPTSKGIVVRLEPRG
ncbi:MULTISPECIES: hypothetical protein [unclassified Streptomyces]|uniref:hypothetical protein n=1 Tax=unclassified Streptomyces TaxID=2593676 RepID=UPI0036574424